MSEFPLGRLRSITDEHIRKHPLRALNLFAPREPVETVLELPIWHKKHDQGEEGACTGFGSSMSVAILNNLECARQGLTLNNIRYDPFYLWLEAKKIDGYDHILPNEGSTVNAVMQICKDRGLVLWPEELEKPLENAVPILSYGIQSYKWATSIDEIRWSIHNNIPVTIGSNWYESFDNPFIFEGESWIARDGNLGSLRGGHCYTLYGFSDKRNAVLAKNSWGMKWPESWLPIPVLDRLLNEDAEAAVVTDRF